jgi:Flp pilus assembly protein TadD
LIKIGVLHGFSYWGVLMGAGANITSPRPSQGIQSTSDAIVPLDPGIELARKGDYAAAEAAFRAEIKAAPKSAGAHHNFAVFLSSRDRPKEAIECYRAALLLRPRYPEALRNFGTLLCAQRQFKEAVTHLWTAVRLRPADIQSLCALGEALMGAKRREEAIPILRQAMRLSPLESVIHNLLGLALFDAGRLDQAEEVFLEALRLNPKFVSAHNNLGSLYKAMGRSAEALTCFELALALDPESEKTKWNRALTLLSLGDFEHGWQEYESRWRRPETPPLKVPAPSWDGGPLEGKFILIHAEQGLGDTVQFIRYARLLKERGARVIFRCQSPLSEALKDVVGVDKMISENEPIPPVDVHAPLMSLPRLFNTTQTSVPTITPYLNADPERLIKWRDHLNEKVGNKDLRIGLAWQGNPHHQWDHFRSLPLQHFEPLTRIPGIRLISLQRGPGIEQIESFQRLTRQALIVPSDGQQTSPAHLADNMAIMANLDLIVTVDTATAHLAAALGKPTWVVLSFIADWRWIVARQDSPWYPSMRLFRQKRLGDWEELIERVVHALRLLPRGHDQNLCS